LNLFNKSSSCCQIKVFKPGLVAGLVQGPGFRFWPGHWVLTGSAGSISILKKIQNGVVLVKKNKSQRVATGFLTGFFRVSPPGQPGHTGSWLMLFFHQPGPVPAPGRPGPRSTRLAGPGFKTLCQIFTNKIKQVNMFSLYNNL